MSYIWFTGFENRTIDDFSYNNGDINNTIVSAPPGFTGNYAYRPDGYGGVVVPEASEYWVNARIYQHTILSSYHAGVLRFAANNVPHIVIGFRERLYIYRNSDSYSGYWPLLYAGRTLSITTAYLIEVYVKIDSVSGRIVLKIDGEVEFDYIGNTAGYNAPGAYINDIRFGTNEKSSHTLLYFDDLIINDSEFSGDLRIYGRDMTASGNYIEFVPSSGTNLSCISDNYDNTYNYTTESGKRDIFIPREYTGDNIIKAIKLTTRCRKSGDVLKIKNLIRYNSSDEYSQPKNPPTDFGNIIHIVDKIGGGEITPTKFNNSEFGYASDIVE